MNAYTTLSFPTDTGSKAIVDVGELRAIQPDGSGSLLHLSGGWGAIRTTSAPQDVLQRVVRAIEVRRGEEDGDRRQREVESIERLVSRFDRCAASLASPVAPPTTVPKNGPGASQHLSSKSAAAARGAMNKLASQLAEAAGWLSYEPNVSDLETACLDAARFVQAWADKIGANLPDAEAPKEGTCKLCGAESRVQAIAKCVRSTGAGQFYAKDGAKPHTMACELEELPRALGGEAPPQVGAVVLTDSPWPELTRGELNRVLVKAREQLGRLLPGHRALIMWDDAHVGEALVQVEREPTEDGA